MKIVNSIHISVIEHVYATFRISDVSRAFSNQLIRHRIATYTQVGLRYIDEHGFAFIVPPQIQENPNTLKVFNEAMASCNEYYNRLLKLGISKEEARYVLPHACTTQIVMTANLREYRHVFQEHGGINAPWELRLMCIEMLKVLKEKCPTVFEDMVIDEFKGQKIIRMKTG